MTQTIEQILALAADTGAVAYSPPPLRAVRGYSFTYDELEAFYHAAIQHHKDSVLKEVGEPVGLVTFVDGECYAELSDTAKLVEFDELFTSDQVAAAILKATKPLDTPIAPSLSAEIERTDWTPAEALQFYADQRNFDIVGSHARIIDNGAVASNALKHLSIDRLELKGDAELAELRAQLAAAQEEWNQCSGLLDDAHRSIEMLEDQLATAKQRVAEAWISVDEQMPNNQQAVLVLYTTHWGKQAVTMGWHTRAKCLDASNFEGEVNDEYDEETDTYYMKEQWVDESTESEYHYPISDVTHWMPLPKAPNGASS